MEKPKQNTTYKAQGIVIPNELIDGIIRENGKIIEFCLEFYPGRRFAQEHNLEYMASCGWICIRP